MWYFIINPHSGSGKSKQKWAEIQVLLEARKIPYQVSFSAYTNHPTTLALEAIQNGHRQLAAIGGDGTIHEVIEGIMQKPSPPNDPIVFTAFAGGTGNDWLRHHPIPQTPEKWVEMLVNGQNIPHDIAKIFYTEKGENKIGYSNNVVGLAYDAAVVAETLSVNKNGILGQFFYFFWILKCLTRYKSQSVKIETSEGKWEGEAFCINIGICKYSGGGMRMVPEAQHDDGLLDITIIKNMPRWKIIWEMRRLYNGTIYGAKQVIRLKSAWITIAAGNTHSPILIEADGELLGTTPVKIETLPHILNIRVASY
jgi:YegS/Rv2252/BmrU family lipid kinase